MRLLLAGDAIVVRPWSRHTDPRFQRLVEALRAADVTVVNLETLIHEHKGYAQADSGGTWATSPPEIAHELKWAGVDMVAHANNHAFDYGSVGVLENLANVRGAGLVLAGSGEDLDRARAPAYLARPDGTVALVSTATTFVPYGRASRSLPGLRGRPGINPLTLIRGPVAWISRRTADGLRAVSRGLGFTGDRFVLSRFRVAGLRVRVERRHRLQVRARLDEADREGNLAAVREAARQAQVVIVSVHAHEQGPWLRRFAHAAIDAGAHVFFAHGPHAIQGIELYRGRPIFHCLGSFVFQTHHIERLPPEYEERFATVDGATPAEVSDRAAVLAARRGIWEGLAAVVDIDAGRVRGIDLIPLDLGFGEPAATRGIPRWAESARGRLIIERVARLSRAHGTRIRYDEGRDMGVVDGIAAGAGVGPGTSPRSAPAG